MDKENIVEIVIQLRHDTEHQALVQFLQELDEKVKEWKDSSLIFVKDEGDKPLIAIRGSSW